MRILKTIVSVSALCALLVSCIKDDLSQCVIPANTALKINYYGDSNDPSLFGRVVDRMTLIVFDESGRQVKTKHIEKQELASQTVRLQLPEGATYRVVCWGNVMDGTTVIKKFPGTSPDTRAGGLFEEYLLHHPHLEDDNKDIPSNDRLYMGETTCTIPVGGNAEGEVQLNGVYCSLEIYVKGFGQKNNPATYPVIEVMNLMPQYNMEAKATMPAATSYFPVVETDAQRDMLAAKPYTLQFDNDNPVVITVKDPATGAVRATINLKEYMINEGISIDGKHDRKVTMQVTFSDLGMTVTIPEWEIIDIRP